MAAVVALAIAVAAIATIVAVVEVGSSSVTCSSCRIQKQQKAAVQ